MAPDETGWRIMDRVIEEGDFLVQSELSGATSSASSHPSAPILVLFCPDSISSSSLQRSAYRKQELKREVRPSWLVTADARGHLSTSHVKYGSRSIETNQFRLRMRHAFCFCEILLMHIRPTQ